MKTTLIVIGILILGFAAGWLIPGSIRQLASTQPSATAPVSQPKQLWTCSMHPQVIQDHPGSCPICHMELTPVNQASGTPGMIEIDPAVVQNMGVRTAPVTEGILNQTIRVVGYVQEQEPLHLDINLRVNGWIEKLYANIDGMAIKKGQKLFDLYSPELAVAVDELIASGRQSDQPGADASTKSFFESSQRKLQQYGLTPEQIAELSKLDRAPLTIPIYSPITGHLTEKMVYEGAAVKAGDLILRLADRHAMWIDTQVYEQQYASVKIGAKATAQLTAEPGRVYEGNVIFIHPHLDPVTRTALARIAVPNEDHQLRKSMYATVDITSAETQPTKLIPREAVINTGTRQVAYVATGPGKFEPRQLKLGAVGTDSVQVLDGLELSEKVVVSGQFLIDSESRLSESRMKTSMKLSGLPPAQRKVALATTTPAVRVPHTDDIVKAYLTIQKRLGNIQNIDEPIDVTPLLKAASMAATHAEGDAKSLASAVASVTEAMNGKPLVDQREQFINVSEAVIALSRVSTPSKTVAATLFVFHCPMAFHDKGANWMQDAEETANPYYAKEMKACGTIEQRINSAE